MTELFTGHACVAGPREPSVRGSLKRISQSPLFASEFELSFFHSSSWRVRMASAVRSILSQRRGSLLPPCVTEIAFSLGAVDASCTRVYPHACTTNACAPSERIGHELARATSFLSALDARRSCTARLLSEQQSSPAYLNETGMNIYGITIIQRDEQDGPDGARRRVQAPRRRDRVAPRIPVMLFRLSFRRSRREAWMCVIRGKR